MTGLAKKTMTILTGLVMLLAIGCQEDSNNTLFGPEQLAIKSENVSISHKSSKREAPSIQWPLIASRTFHYDQETETYEGGVIKFPKGHKSRFMVEDSSLTPPVGTPVGEDVVITMQVDFDEELGELIFTFGPSGSQFSPAARIRLDYSALGIDIPNLYYIDEHGNYIQQKPQDLDIRKRWIWISVHHFSRYALSRA